jgi:hypothetical protein
MNLRCVISEPFASIKTKRLKMKKTRDYKWCIGPASSEKTRIIINANAAMNPTAWVIIISDLLHFSLVYQ